MSYPADTGPEIFYIPRILYALELLKGAIVRRITPQRRPIGLEVKLHLTGSKLLSGATDSENEVIVCKFIRRRLRLEPSLMRLYEA